eukprot:gene323-585_t
MTFPKRGKAASKATTTKSVAEYYKEGLPTTACIPAQLSGQMMIQLQSGLPATQKRKRVHLNNMESTELSSMIAINTEGRSMIVAFPLERPVTQKRKRVHLNNMESTGCRR